MLTITKLKGAEYLIASVADGMEDYYMGAGEAPGVWRGGWADKLGLSDVVGADELRALVNGVDPNSDVDLLAGHRERKVRAIDVTLSVPKSASLLWAFGTPETSAVVSIAVVEATDRALVFMEDRTAVARQQRGGVRRRVATDGFAIASFAHRTSRAGDPQLHTHCLIPNVVRRADGQHVAFDANPLHVWGKATGTVFLNELEALLTERLGVAWGPERNGSRELVGFSPTQLRAFSKRTVAIETHLEAEGELVFDNNRDRMRADDRASLATRARKDKNLTPQRLRERWAGEAEAVGLDPGAAVDDLVLGRQVEQLAGPTDADIFGALTDPATGLCARESRFGEAHVVERVAALSGGRLTLNDIVGCSRRFLTTDLVVRLTPDITQRRPAEWSTVELRAVEDRTLAGLHELARMDGDAIEPSIIEAAIAAETKALGADQIDAVRLLCGAGPSIRALVAPDGYGKTTTLHAAATASETGGRHVVALAPTHKAAAELRAAGLDAQTIASFRCHLTDTTRTAQTFAPETTVIVDEVSLVGTRDAAALIEAVVSTRAQVWLVGDGRQAQSVAAGGLCLELERLAGAGTIAAVSLTDNRRQHDPAERVALAKFRAGDVEASQTIRTAHGWEHQDATPAETRDALAEAAIADADRHGAEHVAVLAVSHADCEDLADRIRAIRTRRGELRGPTLTGPAWGPDLRVYAAGDRVVVHANLGGRARQHVFNGSTGVVLAAGGSGLEVLFDNGHQAVIDAAVVAGYRPDGTPNLSHAWARTIDGAQGGTWRQVHLLGTPALNHFTAYTGQSRGQHPTHTWNTRPEADHPFNLLADDRDASEAVGDAMRRAEPKTFAAIDDPWTVDRELRSERDEHRTVIATRPPDLSRQLEHARANLSRAIDEQHYAVKGVVLREDERARLGPLTRVRRRGREVIAQHDEALTTAHRRLEHAEQAVNDTGLTVNRLDTAVAELTAWDRQHHWRLTRIAEIGDRLAHHWADVTLRAVRADEPLAFGVDRLRNARATYRADLARIHDRLPADRRDDLSDAEVDLRRHEHHLHDVKQDVAHARYALDGARRRHWRHRDKNAISQAARQLSDAEQHRDNSAHNVKESRNRLKEEQKAVHVWEAAMHDTADERGRLSAAVRDTDTALDTTRPQRVATATRDPFNELWDALGPPPTTRGGQAAWCGIAERIETLTDHDPTGRTVASRHMTTWAHATARRNGHDQTTSPSEHARQIIDTATRHDPTPAPDALNDRTRWQPALHTAQQAHAIQPPEQDSGMELEL